jgi:hypothetical protein
LAALDGGLPILAEIVGAIAGKTFDWSEGTFQDAL